MANTKTREDMIREEMESPIQLDLSVDVRVPRANIPTNAKEYPYHCTCCGKGFKTQKNNFQKSASPLFQSNDGYLPWCKSCTDNYYYKLVDLFSGNESHAIDEFCHVAGWVYSIEGLKAAKQISADRSRISHYAAKKNLGQVANIGKTYIDSMKYDYQHKLQNVITSKEQIQDSIINKSAIDRWGMGLSEIDYKNLEDHYRMLKKNNPNADANQEIFIKTLCTINSLMIKASRDGDSDKYVKLAEQYNKTFKQAGLRTIEEKDSSNDEVLGVTLATISQYTPEEFYKDKTLYSDNDHIGEYFDRHIRRPMKNLQFGTDERDTEFFVPDGDADD